MTDFFVVIGIVALTGTIIFSLYMMFNSLLMYVQTKASINNVSEERKSLKEVMNEIGCEEMFNGITGRQPTKWYVSNGLFQWVGLASTAGEAVALSLETLDPDLKLTDYFRVNQTGYAYPKLSDTLFETKMTLEMCGYWDEFDEDEEFMLGDEQY